jgi:hypothetical protein
LLGSRLAPFILNKGSVRRFVYAVTTNKLHEESRTVVKIPSR